MSEALVSYLASRSDTATFLIPAELGRTVQELFGRPDVVLPQPYKIFPADEAQPPILGFPLAETSVMKDIDARLDRWIADEVLWQVTRQPEAKEKAQISMGSYLAQVVKTAENALMSNLLSDYHGVFWLAHSFDLARQFSSIPRRVSALDVQAGRTQGDALKYRIFQRWAGDTREQMTQVAGRAAAILDGDEQRALQFFRLLQDDVLILTEEFVGPDLRELRSFINGYLRRDFQGFRDGFERLRTTVSDVLQRDRSVRSAMPLFGVPPEQGVTVALLLDPRFMSFIFDYPAVQNAMSREEREQYQLIARRLREFAVLNQLRRAIIWTNITADDQIVSADRRTPTVYSRSTRPLDFGRSGVVDPVVHRFGLIYDISRFSETLGDIRRGGGKEEIKSYRQMLLFQRRMETIAERHMLQFEKFLGDGAFYTTRRALRLIRAAVEIQRFYSEMKRKGFAFHKGLRIALNYGYYRLLPMKAAGAENTGQTTEFYGLGIVELSRLTTGKSTKEIEDIAGFLITHGYDAQKVQQFFAPLARGVDVIDHTQHAREFYAYVNANGHLINEGIVASMPLLQELSTELANEAQPLFRLHAQWANYLGFGPAVPGLEFVGIRLLGMISVKGLENLEVGEIVPFAPGEVDATPIDSGETLVSLLRQDFHQPTNGDSNGNGELQRRNGTTAEHAVEPELVICLKKEAGMNDDVVIGEWDPRSDEVNRSLRLPRSDFQRLFELKGDPANEIASLNRESVRHLYERLADEVFTPPFQLATYRLDNDYATWIVGEVVERL